MNAWHIPLGNYVILREPKLSIILDEGSSIKYDSVLMIVVTGHRLVGGWIVNVDLCYIVI